MYLVFIAIVAISVSENVLISYKDTERSLDHSKKLSEEKNKVLYQTLKIKSDNDVGKFGDLNQTALEIQNKSTQTVERIEQMKNDMLNLGKIESLDGDVQYSRLENSKVPHDYFFKTGIILSSKTPSKQGKKLIDEISILREYLLDFINKDEYKNRFFDLNESIARSLNTDNFSSRGREGNQITWIEGKFGDVPLISAITTLSQLQAEIRSFESDLVSRMLEGQLSSEISYSNYSTLLDAKKTAFFSGEKFDGSIALGRSDKTTKPARVEVILDGRRLSENEYTLEKGEVVLNFSVGLPGEHKLTGNLIFNEADSAITVPINSSYIVIPKPNSAVISNEKMNILYRAVNNPLSISVPGISDNNVRVNGGQAVRKKNSGNYIANVTNVKRKNLDIRVSAKLPNGETINTKRTFRIKDIPAPKGIIRGKTEDRMPIGSFLNSTVGASLQDFPFDLKLDVQSFAVKIPGVPTIKVSGSRMNDRVRRTINRIRPGEQVIISNIVAKVHGVSNYRVKKVSPVIVTITGR